MLRFELLTTLLCTLCLTSGYAFADPSRRSPLIGLIDKGCAAPEDMSIKFSKQPILDPAKAEYTQDFNAGDAIYGVASVSVGDIEEFAVTVGDAKRLMVTVRRAGPDGFAVNENAPIAANQMKGHVYSFAIVPPDIASDPKGLLPEHLLGLMAKMPAEKISFVVTTARCRARGWFSVDLSKGIGGWAQWQQTYRKNFIALGADQPMPVSQMKEAALEKRLLELARAADAKNEYLKAYIANPNWIIDHHTLTGVVVGRWLPVDLLVKNRATNECKMAKNTRFGEPANGHGGFGAPALDYPVQEFKPIYPHEIVVPCTKFAGIH